METVYSALIKKKIFKHFHATSFVTRKDDSKNQSLTNLKIQFKKNNYDSMVALSGFVADLKESKITSSMLKEISDSNKSKNVNVSSFVNQLRFQLIILSITSIGLMWGWGLKSQDDILISQVDSIVSISISDKTTKEKDEIENRIEKLSDSYTEKKIWVITAVNYIIIFLTIFVVFYMWLIFSNKSDLIINKLIEDSIIYMKYEER